MVNNNDHTRWFCWNCGIEIIDHNLKICPDCNAILSPNEIIKWNISWLLFLLVLCIIPFAIVIIISYFF